MTMPAWEPHVPRAPRRIRVAEYSCCDAYQLCSEAGQYFILRQTETGGVCSHARQVWDELLAQHTRSHRPEAE
ncbi:hypothetical protein [Nonomuraea diastatica]|uniref:Uncharacterized protein n=1 Tax=Nonomuraea diastatica TaxID=1848329 RepID=A0A4R4VWH8_9ACTN|nr:hypothetical protein [Nonomuraea diastatica]TDD10459.1 hypothetical protein E1294_46140 [Nonomuraea diastatica]